MLVALAIAAAGLLISLVEGIVSRRRTYAALVATGVPRSVLARAVAWQSLTPAVPAVLLALTVGALLGQGLLGEPSRPAESLRVCVAEVRLCDDSATFEQYTRPVELPAVIRTVPVPVEDLAQYALLALLAILVTAGVGVLFLRSSSNLEELRAG